jgi:hypothetical protein
MASPPNISTFLVADSVFQQASGKWCVIGVFSKIQALQFPTIQFSMGLFVVASNFEGTKYAVKIEFTDSKDATLATMEGIEINDVPSRRDTVEFGIQTGGLPLIAPGRYTFKLYFNNELATIKDIDAELLQQPGGQLG